MEKVKELFKEKEVKQIQKIKGGGDDGGTIDKGKIKKTD